MKRSSVLIGIAAGTILPNLAEAEPIKLTCQKFNERGEVGEPTDVFFDDEVPELIWGELQLQVIHLDSGFVAGMKFDDGFNFRFWVIDRRNGDFLFKWMDFGDPSDEPYSLEWRGECVVGF